MYYVQGNEKDEEYIVEDPISKKQFKSICKINGTNYMFLNLETNMIRKIIEVEDTKLLPKHPGANYNI